MKFKNGDKPTIFGLVSDRAGCGFHRMVNPLSSLERQGLAEIVLVWHGEEKVTSSDFRLKAADFIIAQRVYDTDVLQDLILARDKYNSKIIYEVDDDLEGIPQYNPAWRAFKSRVVRDVLPSYKWAVSKSDAVSTTCQYLANKIGAYSSKVLVMPNGIDFRLLSGRNQFPEEGDRRRLLYWGSASHFVDFVICMPAVQQIMTRYDDVDLVLFGYMPVQDDFVRTQNYGYHVSSNRFNFDDFYRMFSKRVEFHDFEQGLDQYYRKLPQLHANIALAPLVDNDFNRCRSNLKLVEASAVGLPMICSKVDPYTRDASKLSDNTTYAALLAKRHKDWFTKLDRLLNDRDAQLSIAERNYTWAHQLWDIDYITRKIWLPQLKALYGKEKV